MQEKVEIAAVQMNVVWLNPEKNLEKYARLGNVSNLFEFSGRSSNYKQTYPSLEADGRSPIRSNRIGRKAPLLIQNGPK